MPRFSANLGFLWKELALPDAIAAAGRAGFQAVELHFPYETDADLVRDACARAGVELLAVNTGLGDITAQERGLGAVPGREADFQTQADRALAWLRRAGGRMLHCMAGNVTAPQRPEAFSTFLRNLRHLADRAGDVTLLLEAQNIRDAPHYFLNSVDRAAELIEAVDRPNVRLMFDIYHVGVQDGDVLTRLQRLLPLTGHVQIAAVPSRHEPDEGEIAYCNIFRSLDQMGYAGWIGAEYIPRQGTDAGLGWRGALTA
ncbi:hydroxypyruvate isomerase family protein [Pseudogemmobacter bohemicus]|uniref:hydroxypyruvate isomerase family protein n=1 Tax=Pseudogemmobacter bohemicus TaxID=2250708 RepID=UPI000DD4D57A|nr:TIM barrel protein [Pseudogemmobacter bohemicus]